MNRKVTVWFCMSAMFLFAVSCSLIGIILPAVISEYQISLQEASIVTVAQNAGGMAALAFSGILADRYGKLKVICCLFLSMTGALLGSFVSGSFWSFVLIACILGLAASALNMCISAYLSDLYPEQSSFYVNLGGVLFGAGSVAGPVYASIGDHFGTDWRVLFRLTGIVCTAALLFLFLAGKEAAFLNRTNRETSAGSAVRGNQGEIRQLLTDRRLWKYAGTGFFYMAHSSAFMAWIPTWLASQTSVNTGLKNQMMTIYWISILAGRILTTWAAERIRYRSYMLAANTAGCFAVWGLIFAKGWMLPLLFILTGVFTASVFQVCLAETCSRFSKWSGTAGSVVAFCASAGGTLSCLITGLTAQHAGFSAAICFLGAVLLVTAGISLFSERKKS